jgi:hypothetical protein
MRKLIPLKSSILLFAASLSLGAWGAMSPNANSASEGPLAPAWALADGRGTEALPEMSATLPRMAPEFALQTFQQRAARQLTEPVSYSANTVVEAELPDTAQKGELPAAPPLHRPQDPAVHASALRG